MSARTTAATAFKPLQTLACLGVVSCAAAAQAQPTGTAAGPGAPSPPHERLSFFEGTWAIAGVPAMESFRETCAWLPEGRRHMVCRARWVGPNGPREGWSIFSYSPRDAAYTYHGFRPGGSVVVQRGAEEAGGWRFGHEEGSGSAARRTRVTITPQPDGSFVFVEETWLGEGPWKAGDVVRFVRSRP